MPMIILILLLAKDGISLIFERGAFNANAVYMVSEALCFLSFSILPYVFRDSITRVYYAFNDSKTPFIIAISSIGLKAVLNWLLILKFNMGIAGITLSTSFITLFNATFLGLFIYKKVRLDYKTLFVNFAKMALAGIITFVACYILCVAYDKIQLPKYVFEFSKIVVVMIACLGLYTGLNLLFKMDYAKELASRILKR